MRVYQMPPDINEKEKVIGGMLTWGQFVWCLGGFIAGLLCFALLGKILKLLAIIPALLVAGCFVPFAFLKIEGMPLSLYIRRSRAFFKKNKQLPNIRINRVY